MLPVLILLFSIQNPQTPSGCADDARYSALVAWVGDWDVRNAAGQQAGSSRVERRRTVADSSSIGAGAGCLEPDFMPTTAPRGRGPIYGSTHRGSPPR